MRGTLSNKMSMNLQQTNNAYTASESRSESDMILSRYLLDFISAPIPTKDTTGLL